MSVPKKNPDFLTPEDFLAGEDGAPRRYEYLNGVVHAMAGGTEQHADIAGSIYASLYGRLRGKRCRPYNSDMLIRIQRGDDLRFYYPDVSVICERNGAASHFQDRPVIIFEVLSASRRRTDLSEKHDAYCGIPTLAVYAVVESEKRAITLWRRSSEDWVKDYYASAEAVLALPEIECELPLAEIYEGTGL